MISNDNKKAFKRLLQSSQTGDPVQASRALADLGQQGVKEVFHNTLKSNNDPLFISASLGHCEVVESILKSFILHCNNNVEIRDDFNSTSPINSASPNPHQNRSSMNHNNLRREDSFFAPISSMCECDNNDFLRSEDDGTSFLTIAIRNGHASVVRVLVKTVKQLLHVVHSSPKIEKKSLLEKDEGAKNNNGNTSGVFNSPKSPEASTMKKTASSSIFDESFNQQNNNNNFGIVIMLQALTNLLNAEDSEGNTPLSLAISENQLSIVKMLVVELNSFKILGDSNNDGSVLTVVDPNGFENNKNENLQSTTRSGRFNITDRTALVAISNVNSNNKTPIPTGRMSTIASPALLRTAATSRTITGGNETKRYASYLWQACKSGDVEVVKFLLSSPVSCDVLLPSIYGTTPLMIACQYGKSEIVKLLLNSCNESCIMTESLLNAEETAPSKKTCVNFAAENGHVEVIQILLSAKREQIANHNNKNDNVILLKDFINHRDQSTGDTPLLAATRNGHTQLVQLLANLFHGSEDSTDILLAQNSASGQTALSIAAARGFDEIVDVLVTLYPELVFIGDYDDVDGFLPIHYAASKNQFEIIENLVAMAENISKNKKNSNNNNNLNVLVSRASESDDTPLSVACRVGATQTVQVILDLAKNSRNSEELLDELILSNDVGQDGVCCCFIACEKGFVDIFCMLLSACPSFDPFSISTCRQSDQCSCLAVAAQNGREEIVQILLMRGRASLISSRSKSNEHRDDDDESDQSDDDDEEENNNSENHHGHLQSLLDLPSLEGVTPVYRACDSGHVGTVSLLLNGGCDGDLATQNGWRPLTIAVYKGHFDCVAELLSRNDISNNGSNEDQDQENIPWVNVNATLSSSASTALHLACSSKSIPKQFSRRYIRDQLLRQFNHEILDDCDDDEENSDGGDVGEENIFNDSNSSLNNPATRILIKRLGTPREKIIRLLLRHGAGINAQTFPAGVFPLFFCAQENHLDCVKALVECGADVALQTQKGFTALDVARACNHEAIARYLELFEDEFSKNTNSNDNFNFANNNSNTNNASTVEMMATLLENILLEREDVAKEYLDEKQIEFETSSVSSWIRWFVESGKRKNELQEGESGGDHHVDADQRQLLQEDRKEEVQKEVIESDDDEL